MTTVVLDASAMVAWLLGDDPALADRVEAAIQGEGNDHKLIAPTLMRSEVANALVMAQRRQRITAAQAAAAAALADAVQVAFEPATHSATELLQVAQAHGLTAYDGQYLELAMRRGAPILSADHALLAAGRAAGLPA